MNILRAGTIVSRVDAATKMYPGVWAAPLVVGTIGGTGGKFLVDGILGGTGLHTSKPQTSLHSGPLIDTIHLQYGFHG